MATSLELLAHSVRTSAARTPPSSWNSACMHMWRLLHVLYGDSNNGPQEPRQEHRRTHSAYGGSGDTGPNRTWEDKARITQACRKFSEVCNI